MKIEFSDHALVQLKNRPRIKQTMVLATINSPDQATASHRQRNLYRKYFGDEILEVVTVTDNDTIVVITQYFLDES